jgi:LmbE family N-acetylglucosaminyl deacetylase
LLIENIDAITADHRHLYLSPHFDDVVYSCGGTIALQARKEERPLIMTIFAGVPPAPLRLSAFARKTQHAMGYDEDPARLIALRRSEDSCACSLLEADYLWLDYLDAIYRGSPALYRHRWAISGRVRSEDRWIESDLVQSWLKLHERLPTLKWYAPLGVGRHVDHQIVSAAARRLLECGAEVLFYEDFPYVLRPQALSRRLREFGLNLKPLLIEISDVLLLRQKAAEMYAMQIKLNFGSLIKLHRSIEYYSKYVAGNSGHHAERYWLPKR